MGERRESREKKGETAGSVNYGYIHGRAKLCSKGTPCAGSASSGVHGKAGGGEGEGGGGGEGRAGGEGAQELAEELQAERRS
jgi:hypothetical protein